MRDPWGHPIQITCTDQPADQIIGARSAGPDGVLHTADDIASWQLGHEVTDMVRGVRWVVARPQPAPDVAAMSATAAKKPATTKPTTTKPVPAATKPAGAVQLDDNGMPIAR